MNYVTAQEKDIIRNNSVVREELRGSARELMPKEVTLSKAVQGEIQKLSVLEVIG